MARDSSEKEHVTLFIYRHPELFKLESVSASGKYLRPDVRLCVDTPEDLKLIQAIFKRLSHNERIFFAEDIMELLNPQSELLKINAMINQKTV